MFKAMSRAWARQDAAAAYRGLLRLRHAATMIGRDQPAGRDDIGRRMAAAFAGPLKDSLRPNSAQIVRFLPGGTAIVVTESGTILPGEAAAPPERRRPVTWLLTCHDDRWLVEANHICQA